MKIHYLCTYWGCESLKARDFLKKVTDHGYDGVEINLPNDPDFVLEFCDELATLRATTHPGFYFIAQQVATHRTESVAEYSQRMLDRLEYLTTLQPNAINSHTGKDYYSFTENCKLLEQTEQLTKASGIPIWHEIHRGRFSFHLKSLVDYFEVFPQLKLVADFSHFSVVSESNLADQHELLQKVFPHIQHIHARIGFEQAAQVNHPFAPEWSGYLELYLSWWKTILGYHQKRGLESFTITPEFGPYPYMPLKPFTREPLASQWDINISMKQFLQNNI
ncbi:sugar phosphate isomerase/epimerase [Flavobacterium sp. N1719]|uniref:sugar phosphate isomerase/epimerase n=1 Tax=Flavobacterium sp. N1719 TaxID=2885633 RepID=UPI002222162F|nr:sugar phosphate isomerase/epimerase [Flavobacterium sp. N1719]